jgi:TatD DNase family protein
VVQTNGPAADAPTVRWFDNHCHLESGPDGAAAVARALEAGVDRLIDVGTDLDRSRQAIATARALGGVAATAGVHPHDAAGGIDGIEALLAEPEVVAVGECGLDYHYDHSPRAVQRSVFAAQIGLAHAHDLPLVIHTREAWDDTFVILDREGTPRRTVFHCFTGGPDQQAEALARGAVMSFSGIVTFKGATEVHQAARTCPLDRMHVETDAPYLAPVPHRGKPNEPAWVAHVGARVAELKGLPVATVAEATWRSADRFFTRPT